MKDKYVNEMDWGDDLAGFSKFDNYRNYQFKLIQEYIGSQVFEIGTGDRSFADQILLNCSHDLNVFSIEPSSTFFELGKNKTYFPPNFIFSMKDIYEIGEGYRSKFDTALMIHVLEHIEDDARVLNHIHPLLVDGGHLLIQVPALQWLFSQHDKSLGHYRRYNKAMIRQIVDLKKFSIEKMWYQDPIGVLGSLYYFKFKKIKLKSDSGNQLINNQGIIYDKYIIPFEQFIEKYITFPFGLSLTIILKKKS